MNKDKGLTITEKYNIIVEVCRETWKETAAYSLVKDLKEAWRAKRELRRNGDVLAHEMIEIHKEQIKTFEECGLDAEAKEHREDLKLFERNYFKPGFIMVIEDIWMILTGKSTQ